jgi:dihydroflavonol-4-reductase
MVDVRDVVDSIVVAINKGKDREVYLLSGKYYSMKELSYEVKLVTGKKVPKMILPYWLLRVFIPFAAVYYKLTKQYPTFTIESIDALKNGHPTMDNSKAKSELGHQCRPLSNTLADFYAWQKEKKVI